MNLDKQISALQAVRIDIADRNRTLTFRELEGRLLRTRLTFELRTGRRSADGKDWAIAPISSNDAAEKAAKVHPDYIEHERETAQQTYERDVKYAEAETLVFSLRVALDAMPESETVQHATS